MIKFSIDYDSQNKTWNVMVDGQCEFYGTAQQCDKWADEHKDTHEESKWSDNPIFNAKSIEASVAVAERNRILNMPEQERKTYLYGDWSV